MTLTSYLASVGPEARILLTVTVLWLSGFLMSRVTKLFNLPNVTGYILAGIAIGPYCLNLLPGDLIANMSFVTDAALAFIAFGVGRYLQLNIIKNQGGKVILLTLMESLVAAALVTVVMLVVFRLPLSFALLLGAIGSATAPASSLMTIRQYRAKGPFVNTLIQVVALDDAVALLAFSVCAAIAAGTESPTDAAWVTMLEPIGINAGVLLVSYILGRLLCVALNGRSSDHRLVLTCAFILLIAGGCAALNVSPLLGCMMLGATYANVTQDKALFKQITRVQPPINVLFFVLSGMRLDISSLATAGIIGVTYFAVRIVGKYLGSALGCRAIHAPEEVRKYLGLALIPQAGVSIGLAVLAQRILPPASGMLINTIILSSSVLYEMIGPMSAKYALVKSGAIHPEASPVPVSDQPAPPPAGKKSAESKKNPARKGEGHEPKKTDTSPVRKPEAPEGKEAKEAKEAKKEKKAKEPPEPVKAPEAEPRPKSEKKKGGKEKKAAAPSPTQEEPPQTAAEPAAVPLRQRIFAGKAGRDMDRRE